MIPPVYAKQPLRAVLQDVWSESRLALETADRVVFYGYSLPEIDVEAEKHFQRALSTNREIQWLDVIDPSPRSAARYAGLTPSIPIRWYPTLSTFLASGGFALTT